jgi:hypothetical protein
MYGLEYAFNVGTGAASLASTGRDKQVAAYKTDKFYQLIKTLGNFAYLIVDAALSYSRGRGATTNSVRVLTNLEKAERMRTNATKEYKGEDVAGMAATLIGLEPLELLSSLLGLILNITNSVYAGIESFMADKETDLQKSNEIRDKVNLSGMIADNGIIEIFAGIMAVAAHSPAPAILRLRANGDAVIKAAKSKNFYAMEAKTGAATGTILSLSGMNAAKIGMAGIALVPSIFKTIDDFGKGPVEDLKTEGL